LKKISLKNSNSFYYHPYSSWILDLSAKARKQMKKKSSNKAILFGDIGR